MNPAPFLRRLRHLFRRRRFESDMAEEMRFHLEQRAADYAARGLPADEARYAAHRKFGNLGSLQESAREGRGWGWLERALKDFHFAWRQLLKSPGFSLLAVVTLGLGIGANTAMFNMINALVFRPLPYDPAGRLDRIFRATEHDSEGQFSAADVAELRQSIAPYGEIAAYETGNSSLSEPGQPAIMAVVYRVPANFFPLLDTVPQLGRNFRPEEEVPGADRVVILSHRLWQSQFGGSADILGRAIRVDGELHTVVGVLPASFNDWRYLGNVDFFAPLALDSAQSADRRATVLRVLARPSGQLSRPEAAAYIAGLGARVAATHPDVNAGATWRIVALRRLVAGKNGPAILSMLIGLSGFVLLIACSNLANLLLVRTIARAREFALRAALGASRLQLLRPLIAESLVLALAGGVLALVVALWIGDWLSVRSTGDNGEQVPFVLDWRVFAWALGTSLVTALAFGLVPALFASRLDLNRTLKSGGRGTTGGRGHQRFRHFLIVGQFALAMVLLAGAALFIRGLDELNSRRAGWDSTQLVVGTLLLPAAHYPTPAKITGFQHLLQERLASLPGVRSASLSSAEPFYIWADVEKLAVEGREPPGRGREPAARVNLVGPDYFATVGTRILAGRTFMEQDNAAAEAVVIVSQSTARALFGEADPLGRRLAVAGTGQPAWAKVVGIAADVISTDSDKEPIPFQLYRPLAQQPRLRIEFELRTAGLAPAAIIDDVRRAVATLDPDLPVRQLMTADARIRRVNYQLAVLRDMLTLLGLLGLGLASLGIYGVIARSMAQRAGEFAIRLALGAGTRDISRLVLLNGVKLAVFGSVTGLAGAIVVARILAAGFPGMRLNSVSALAGTTVLLIAVALFACWLPARRAGKVDAMQVLRAE